jgi:hypothetical protein
VVGHGWGVQVCSRGTAERCRSHSSCIVRASTPWGPAPRLQAALCCWSLEGCGSTPL